MEALSLLRGVAADPRAADAERAIAICWLLHVIGDLHQPLHTAERFDAAQPEGDFAGLKRFVIDSETNAPVSLHWFWDDAVHRAAEPDSAVARAAELVAHYPRARFASEMAAGDEPSLWAAESFAIARDFAYRPDVPTAIDPARAVRPSAAYAAAVDVAAERRLTLSGYRLADLFRALFANFTAATSD